MTEWFSEMASAGDIVESLTADINGSENEYCFPFSAYWVRGFLRARLHDTEGAIADIRHVYHYYDAQMEIPEKVIRKIYEADKL